MPTTANRGYTYPDSTGSTQLWQHFETLADDIDTDIDAVLAELPVRVAAGLVEVTLAAAASGFTAITFPVGRFTVAPLVVATLNEAPGGSAKFVPRVIAITTSGANVYCYTGDATTQTASVDVAWLAIQMTASTAAG